MIQYAGWLGGYEIVLIVVVVLLLFGGKKIPELAKGLGKGIREFKTATEDSDLAKDIKDVASEVNDLKKDSQKLDPRNITKSTKSSDPKK